MPEVAIAVLEMHWQGIIDLGANTLFLQKVSELIALTNPHRVLIIDVEIAASGLGQLNTIDEVGLGEQPLVALGIAASALRPLVKVLQLDMKNRCLQGIQPAIDAHSFVQVPYTTPMHPQHRKRIG